MNGCQVYPSVGGGSSSSDDAFPVMVADHVARKIVRKKICFVESFDIDESLLLINLSVCLLIRLLRLCLPSYIPTFKSLLRTANGYSQTTISMASILTGR